MSISAYHYYLEKSDAEYVFNYLKEYAIYVKGDCDDFILTLEANGKYSVKIYSSLLRSWGKHYLAFDALNYRASIDEALECVKSEEVRTFLLFNLDLFRSTNLMDLGK